MPPRWLGGASFCDLDAIGHFSAAELPLSINSKETLAVFYALKSFLWILRGKHVLVLSDNTTAISYIANMGDMNSQYRDALAQTIWELAADNNFWISISHIPGRINVQSDINSRTVSQNTEWTISHHCFQHICQVLDFFPEIDLFASMLNHKLPSYASWHADPASIAVDAFLIDWSNFNGVYIFPLFSLLSRCLTKLEDNGATGFIIGPLWPTQTWFPHMLYLLASPLVLLPPNSLFQPWNQEEKHPLNPQIFSAICSTSPARRANFQKRLNKSSQNASLTMLRELTDSMAASGFHFVWNNRSIPCVPLFHKSWTAFLILLKPPNGPRAWFEVLWGH